MKQADARAVASDKIKVPGSVKRICGKLNVPRERFRVTKHGVYVWAGIGRA